LETKENLRASKKEVGMVLKCTFTFPDEKQQEVMAFVKTLPSLADRIVQKSSSIANRDNKGGISITVLYEFERPRVMEIAKEVFGQRDIFAGTPGFIFSAEFCSDILEAFKERDGAN
jgi:hypothetical protein